jgi:hypothetical protein
MDNFTYHNPTKIIFGKNTIADLGKEIKRSGFSHVLLLAGGGSIKMNGVFEQVINSLNQSGIEYSEFWGVRPNPTLEHSNLVREFVMQNKIEAIVAVGGGSVIDEAKAVAAGVFVENIWDMFEGKSRAKQALPIFTVLTLSATGTEMNSFAVISNEAELKKWSFGNPLVYPKVTIIDPTVQFSLPQSQIANGGVDSLAHLMENYFMGNNAEVTFGINESVQRTVISEISKLIDNPNDYNARANFTWSSTLALNGITSVAMGGGEWTVHGIEHSLSVLKPEVAHGEGLAILFPAWIEYVADSKPEHFKRWAKNVWNSDNVSDGIKTMKDKFKSWGSPTSLREIDFGIDDFNDIINCTLLYGRMGRIKQLSETDLYKILEISL